MNISLKFWRSFHLQETTLMLHAIYHVRTNMAVILSVRRTSRKYKVRLGHTQCGRHSEVNQTNWSAVAYKWCDHNN